MSVPFTDLQEINSDNSGQAKPGFGLFGIVGAISFINDISPSLKTLLKNIFDLRFRKALKTFFKYDLVSNRGFVDSLLIDA